MKLLYLASALLATATVAHAQLVFAAFAAIQFVIEIIEAESGVALMLEIESSIGISTEVVAGEMTFGSETVWATGSFVEDEVVVEGFGADVFMSGIDPVPTDVVDEPFWANRLWMQKVRLRLMSKGNLPPMELLFE